MMRSRQPLSRIQNALAVALLGMLSLSSARAQTPAPQAAPQSPELAEAHKLAVQVVELYNKKRYDEALPLARRVLEIREHALGPEHLLVGEAAQNLAAVQTARKNYDEALSLYRRALKILETAYGPDAIKLAQTLDNLGWLYVAQAKDGQAEEMFQRALAIREHALGPEHPDVAKTLDVLAQLYDTLERYGKAVDYYKRAIAIQEKAPAPNKALLADYLERCGCAMAANGQRKEGYEMMTQARKVRIGTSTDHSQRVTGQVLQGKASVRVEPVYPPEAKRRRISGTVIVEVTVDEAGNVVAAHAICGPALLRETAVEAARKWRFTPTTLSDKPVKVIGTITFNFNM